MATGIADHGIAVSNWREGIDTGGLRLCPVCDAYEIIGKGVAVVARTEHALAHALFLKGYTDSLTLYHVGTKAAFDPAEAAQLAEAGIELIHAPSAIVEVDAGGGASIRHMTTVRRFDTIYPMFGCHPRSDIAKALGAACDAEGNLVTDAYQETNLPRVFAIGDVVSGLNQISVAVGQAAVAATHIHHCLPGSAGI